MACATSVCQICEWCGQAQTKGGPVVAYNGFFEGEYHTGAFCTNCHWLWNQIDHGGIEAANYDSAHAAIIDQHYGNLWWELVGCPDPHELREKVFWDWLQGELEMLEGDCVMCGVTPTEILEVKVEDTVTVGFCSECWPKEG